MFSRFFHFILTTLIYIIYPPLCPVCKEIVDNRGQICNSCIKKIFRLDEKNPLPENLSEIFIITKYRGGTRDLLRKLKFNNDLNVLPTIKKILSIVADNPKLEKLLAKVDCAIFVPLHKNRFKERGYNQTEMIFKDFFEEKELGGE